MRCRSPRQRQHAPDVGQALVRLYEQAGRVGSSWEAQDVVRDYPQSLAIDLTHLIEDLAEDPDEQEEDEEVTQGI